jgi:uncharacterized protein YdeI (YjbR/CyaY-like superfamily)
MKSFKAEIYIIGINPYVLIPENVLEYIFTQAGKDKGPVPVRGTINGFEFIQTLVKYRGMWRLYLNTPMRKSCGKDVGDVVKITLEHDAKERIITMHPDLEAALKRNKKAKTIFDQLPPSRRKEIVRYINALKTEESRARNIKKAIQFLLGKERFAGRDTP